MPDSEFSYATEFLRAIRGESHELEAFIDRPAGRLSRQGAIQVYQRAYVARLSRALGGVFKTVKRILGDELFSKLAFEFVMGQPSLSYSLDHYHPEFSHFLLSYFKKKKGYAPQVAQLIFDLGRLEWISHVIFRGARPSTAGTVISTGDDLIVEFNQSLNFIETQYDISNLRVQVSKASESRLKFLVDQTLEQPHERWVFVFLRGEQIYLQDVAPREGEFIMLLQELRSLNSAVENMAKIHEALSPEFVSRVFAILREMDVLRQAE